MSVVNETVISESTAGLQPAILALADGTIFKGFGFGRARGIDKAVVGEVVFNTSMYGYQEILTDPSYAGQIVTFTYPHIGNVGCNPEDNESDRVFAEGMIIRNLTRVTSNFRAKETLPQYLDRAGIMGICGIDTRALVSHLRDRGSQMGAIASGNSVNSSDLVDLAKAQGSMVGKDYVQHVSCKEAYAWHSVPWVDPSKPERKIKPDELSRRPHVVALDCGIKHNILRLLTDVGFRVTAAPAISTFADLKKLAPDAVFLSNGPGDPATLGYIVKTVKECLGRYPIFGICLGHQILAQAVGAKTYKLKFGHRGGNHPVIDTSTQKVEITVQNHGFAVDRQSIPKSAMISHINLNDQTVEGLSLPEHKAFCVQYHPEASPGPFDAQYLFRRFYEMVVG